MIELNRSSIVIRNVDKSTEEYKNFEKYFSLYNPVTHKYEYHVYEEIGNDLRIPVTVGYNEVARFFPKKNVTKNYASVPKAEPIDMHMVHEPRTEIQQEALGFLLSMTNDHKLRFRMLNLATGSGKTFVTISAIQKLAFKAFIIVDTVDLAEQWKKEILFHTDLTAEEICIISGKESIADAKTQNYKIFIAIHKTLGMLLSEDQNSVNLLMHDLGIGIRVFDECHVNFHNSCLINALSDVNYTILLTATPNRSDFREDKLYSKVFGKVPSYDGNKTNNEKYHKILLANFNSEPNEKEKAYVKTKYGFSLNRWAAHIANSGYENYYKELHYLLDTCNLIELDKKVAIMLPTIDLIDKTFDSLSNDYPNISIGRFIGDVKKAQRSNELDKRIFLTNQKIFGKGIDVPDLDCIINFVQLSSQVNLEQIVGRLRNNPGFSHVLIDVTDFGYLECRNQLKSRKRFYKKIAKQIIEIKGE